MRPTNPGGRHGPAKPGGKTLKDEGAKNRGRRAGVNEKGEAIGSGAGAGSGGNPEDYDTDVQAGQ
jgi:hypothetical protein